MIIESILQVVYMLVTLIMQMLPPLGEFPHTFFDSISNVLTVIFSNLEFLGIFVRIDTIKLLAPLVIVVITFEFDYHVIMWIIDKVSKIKGSF